MKGKNLFTIAAVSTGLTLGVATQTKAEQRQEQRISSSDVPAAVRSAAQAQAQGGVIVRWEKEGANYEAVIQKSNRQIGLEMDANGRLLSKHNESNENKTGGYSNS